MTVKYIVLYRFDELVSPASANLQDTAEQAKAMVDGRNSAEALQYFFVPIEIPEAK